MAKPVDLQTQFITKIAHELNKTLGIKNPMASPKLTKISVNVGMGTYLKNNGGKDFSHILESIQAITGQKPVVNKASKAISNFKVRQGEPVGISVTLRGKKMYDFMNKLINVIFPRVRDFRGVSDKSFDGNGNFSIGFKEHVAFPEISPDEVMNLHGLQINIVTSAKDDETGYKLLKEFGFPFKKN